MLDPRDFPPGLQECRQEIDRIDAEIVRLLSARLTVVLQAAAAKRAVGIPFRDEEREAQILENAGERAIDFGLPKKNVRKIFAQVLKISEKSQAPGD